MTALTISETAEELRVSPSMVRKLIAVDGLPHVRLGSRVIVPREDLEAWLAKRVRGKSA
jgi:excisionase family DNA binding protein